MKSITRAALIGGGLTGSLLFGFLAGFEFYQPTRKSVAETVVEIQRSHLTNTQPQINLGERSRIPFSPLLALMSLASGGAALWLLAPWLLGDKEETEEESIFPVSTLTTPPRIALDSADPAKPHKPEAQPVQHTTNVTVHPLQRLIDLLDKTKGGSDVEAVKHLLIEGSTGDGKSTLTSFLPHLIHGSWLVIDPHRKPTQWRGLPVFGGGRNYTEIAIVLEAVYGLMISRYKLRDKGLDVGGVVNIVIDEYPAIVASEECEDIAPMVVKSLLREARKVGIRVVLLVQGSEVKTLKIEGEGSVRKNLLHIHCGSVAKDYAKSKNPSVYNRIKDLDFCYLLNGELLPVPKLVNVPTNYQFQPLPAELQELKSTPVTLEFQTSHISPEAATLNKLFALESAPNPHDSHQQPKTKSTTLNHQQQAILDYCSRKAKPLTPREIKQATLAALDGLSTDNIREIIDSLIALGHGSYTDEGFTL